MGEYSFRVCERWGKGGVFSFLVGDGYRTEADLSGVQPAKPCLEDVTWFEGPWNRSSTFFDAELVQKGEAPVVGVCKVVRSESELLRFFLVAPERLMGETFMEGGPGS